MHGFFVSACLLALCVPFLTGRTASVEAVSAFPGWPTHYDGMPLETCELGLREAAFARAFPGRVARFRAGTMEIVMRWVSAPTRRLHPASDCFRGLGYRIEPLPLHVDEQGRRFGRMRATKGDLRLLVSERIYDEKGGQWTDPSSWWWAATLGASGPWWAVTLAE